MEEQISTTEAKLSAHEAVCAERYLGINGRLKRLEQILITSAGFSSTVNWPVAPL